MAKTEYLPDAQRTGTRYPPTRWQLAVPTLALVIVTLCLAQSDVAPPPFTGDSRLSYDPQLRINTRQHTSRIFAIDVDAEGRYLVTGSSDKTVRVWSLSEMEPLSVLRVPIGTGVEGQIQSLAISPDGDQIAVGGASKLRSGQHVVYVLDRETGRIEMTLTMEMPARELTFSPDGSILGAALGARQENRGGTTFWRTDSWSLVKSHTDFDAESFGLAIDAANRAFTASMDGTLRRIDSEGNIVDIQLTETGRQPMRIAVSSETQLLAVSYFDVAAVDIFDANTLDFVRSLETPASVPDSEIKAESLFSLGWDPDGETLYVAGTYAGARATERELPQIYEWKANDDEAIVGIQNTQFPVLDVVPLGDRRFAFAGFGPGVGLFDEAIVRYEGPEKITQRSTSNTLSVSDDGRTIMLQLPDHETTSAIVFHADERRVESRVLDDGEVSAPKLVAENFSVTEWRNSYTPQLNGNLIELGPLEESLSLAISEDESLIALGAQFTLRLLEETGATRWSISAPEFTEQVNISGDNKLVVASFDDGTIRWFDAEDGDELVALYVDPDSLTWILWTPSGYYDASAGGDNLIGWHLNRGETETPLFYSAARFRDVYYRPDLVMRTLQEYREPDPMTAGALLSGLPPVVQILDVANEAEGFIDVTFAVSTPSNESLSALHVVVGGRHYDLAALGGDADDVRPGVPQRLRVPIFSGDSAVEIVAETPTFASDASTRGIQPALGTPEPPRRNLYAVVIGISDYEDLSPLMDDLDYADDDAVAVSELLQLQAGNRLYDQVDVRTLINAQATRAEIIESLNWLRNAPTENDVAIVYIAGHGLNDRATGQSADAVRSGDYYFLPWGARVHAMASTGVAGESILRFMRQTRGTRLLFFDTCFSGNVDSPGLVNLMSNGTGAIVYSSADGNKPSYESNLWGGGHGAFTAAFIEGARGRADMRGRPDKFVDHLEIGFWLSSEVSRLTNAFDPIQVPVQNSQGLAPTEFLEIP